MRRGFWTTVRIFADDMRLETSIIKHKLADPRLLKALLKLVLVIFVLFLLSNVVSYFLVNPDELTSLVLATEGFAPLIIILLIILEVVIAPLPGFIIMVVAGYLYGPVLGAFYSYVGNVVGSLLAFLLAHYFGRPFVEKLVSHRMVVRYDNFFLEKRKYLVFFYMLPIFPVDIMSFICGFSNLSWKRFLLIVTLGFIPNTLILASFGGYLSELNWTLTLVYFGIFLVVFGLLVWLFRWIMSRMPRKSDDEA